MTNLQQHEENLRQAEEMTTSIREKVAQLIDSIKVEERKLLEQIDDFQLAERRFDRGVSSFERLVSFRLIEEKKFRLNDLTSVERFCAKSRTTVEK